jgi:hypothetical protein
MTDAPRGLAVPELGSALTWDFYYRTIALGPTGVEVLGKNDAIRPWTSLDEWLTEYLRRTEVGP